MNNQNLRESDGTMLLSLEMLREKLQGKGYQMTASRVDKNQCLRGVRLFEKDKPVSSEYLYVTDQTNPDAFPFKSLRLVIITDKEEPIPAPCHSCLIVHGSMSVTSLLSGLEDIFDFYRKLTTQILRLLCTGAHIDTLCKAAIDHFHAPVYIHDEFFHILSCPLLVDGVTNFAYNEKTNRYTQDSDTITLFKTSSSYKKTLTTKGGSVWVSDFNDASCLYTNIWIGGLYRGRLLVISYDPAFITCSTNELTFFGWAFETLLKQSHLLGTSRCHPIEQLIADALEGIPYDEKEHVEVLDKLLWKKDDLYLCGYLSFYQSDFSGLSVYGICNELESRIKDSCTCFHKNRLYVLFNLTKGGETPSLIRMKMSYIIRENLIIMGVSRAFTGIEQLASGFKEAEIAAEYGKDRKVPSWYNEFSDFLLDCWLTEGTTRLSLEHFLPEALKNLIDYDKTHDAQLYLTLKTYLENERNTTTTARLLKINRSTLPHRLDKILSICQGMNLEDEKTRLHLLMGFYVMDRL